MKTRYRLLLAIFLILCFIKQSDTTARFGVDLQIAVNIARDSMMGGYRKVYIYLEEKHFTEKTLRGLFARMAEEYSQPESLTINACSDEELLAAVIDDHLNSAPSFRARDSGKKTDGETLVELRGRKDYYYAVYHRDGLYRDGVKGERMTFTVDPRKKEMVTINLKP